MIFRGNLRRLAASLVVVIAMAAPATAQHEHHGHGAEALPGRHVMPPMPAGMPMLPALMGEVPPVSAWLPAFGLSAADFPAAEPSRTVELADGDTLDLVPSPVRRTIRGREYLMYGYNNQYPGPLIKAPQGARVMIRVRNEIEWPTTIHWHGIRLQSQFDGVPGLTQPPIAPGETFLYEIDVPDDGMFWYHPHARADVQQDLGLYGNLLVLPSAGVQAEEARHFHREELLTLDDLLISAGGELVPYGEEAPTHALMGRFGNVVFVNGETDLRLEADRGEVIRFYLTNVANARTFAVRFGNARVKLVGSDLGPYETEQWVESVIIAPAERYAVDVRFPEAGDVAITNTIQVIDPFKGEFFPSVDTLAVVSVASSDASPDLRAKHGTLRHRPGVAEDIDNFRSHSDRAPDFDLIATVRTRNLPTAITLHMEQDTFYVPPVEWEDPMPEMNWLSTGAQVTWILRDAESLLENDRIHWTFQQGDIVKIRIFNDPRSFHPMNHPIHVHGQRFLVVKRDGIPQTNLVWKDTANLPVGSTMELVVEMSNPGDWMLHCHINEHLGSGMHMHFTVEPADD